MVHALREVHRVLAPGGVLIDARPDSRVLAYAERQKARGFQRFGVVNTSSAELVNDRASDRAIARVVREGLFKRRRRGRFWHRLPFANLAAVRQYLWEHLRFVRRANWVVDAATRRRYSAERFVIRRAVRYELLEARPTTSVFAADAGARMVRRPANPAGAGTRGRS
ncbi:MAG: hypothetical protein AUH80_01010 [Chloroflexi bacterium 13_1_40CM_4_65_16]|nr:MAG: hypothetical protein AUH80_01010 [Chloroflexi bacterium 13_1_40CM_4_65_16]